VAGAALGVWLDRQLHTAVLFTALLALVGFGLGMVLMVRAVRRHRDKLENA
jgi:F0F1-type ATP synthase assembly protein I